MRIFEYTKYLNLISKSIGQSWLVGCESSKCCCLPTCCGLSRCVVADVATIDADEGPGVIKEDIDLEG